MSLGSLSVRSSGRTPDKYYIDISGHYKICDIVKLTGVDFCCLEEIYISQKALLDKVYDVYYFPSRENALKAVENLEKLLTSKGTGKTVYLTFEEMEYIRQALINEGSNIINVRNELKKGIFDKFKA